ncbi:kinesin-1 heavy chain-like [Galleria mellonella]|uniref:Kinesin-1 heavy chain-like n=1 Tax=Galleria mellonella TaxID=7137 RepID=A0A6J1WXC7_GALME|nr:kinesin-1 heavy chain-like [Galleria mellonella]
MSNVKLAIRVRPFSERELKSEKDRIPVVTVVDYNTVTITNVKVSVSGAGDSRERVRRYYADYTFDSACPVTNPTFANQETIFETIGQDVIRSVSRGCSACVLAYGQSATGKTYTMMGTYTQPGLVPRLCTALAELQSFDLTVSFLEIYNERVHDLLAGEVSAATCHSLPRRRGNSRKDLRVREHPQKGPYVQNLRRVAVHDVQTLLSLVHEGAHRRRTAATRRNSTSSRSHALLELTTSTATLHLADLAGSEKASWEGCGGGRQKEGANINKSLVALSNVISALVSGGAGRGRFVPYRDSALTWLLKDCFTGGASTFIIATVSPSVACYGESASTLRWAARARQLPTPRVIHTGPNAVTRAVLQSQFNQLLTELSRNHIQYVPETGKIFYEDKHWRLQINKSDSDGSDKTTKIGNIMNLSHPKMDAHSESATSSVASGSSEVINTIDKNADITNKISKEVDRLLGSTLERTNSGSNLKAIAPVRHKRRQYRSQEILPIDESLCNRSQSLVNALPSQSEEGLSVINKNRVEKQKVNSIPILYDNQRAEIVASVTERLYSKLKKKEEAAVSKIESVVDKKIMEPLSELRICTNARQRFIDLSQKTIRNKRRIGIPAHTQTRISVTRVKDQEIDVQTDLEAYVYKNRHFYALQRDAATETVTMTPRCKEIAVGSKYASINYCDRSTLTETKEIIFKSSMVMTDNILTCDRSTQTPIVPPPRKKKRVSSLARYLKNIENKTSLEECSLTPIININISQSCSTDPESQSSDDNLGQKNYSTSHIPIVTSTPDLLTNHSAVETSSDKNEEIGNNNNNTTCANVSSIITESNICHISPQLQTKSGEDFPDSEDCTLPKVPVDTTRKKYHEEMKEMILGRNKNVYPYNIVLSPLKVSSNYNKIVKFKDTDGSSGKSVGSQTSWECRNKKKESCKSNISSDVTNSDKEYNEAGSFCNSTFSYSGESNNIETDSFIWRKSNTNQFNRTGYLGRSYTPVYKNQSRYRTAKARFYKEFLGLESSTDKDTDLLKCPCCKFTYCKCCSDTKVGSKSNISQKISSNSAYIPEQNIYSPSLKDITCMQEFECEILNSCNDLEESVNRYDKYLLGFPKNSKTTKNLKVQSPVMTPTEYLHHLVQLRREVIKADCKTDSFCVSEK